MSHVRRTFGLGAKIHEKSAEMELALSASTSRGVKLKTRSVGEIYWECPERLRNVRRTPSSTLALEHQVNGLSPGPLPADLLTPPLWQCGLVTVLGGRWFLSAHKPCVSLQMGVDLFVLKNQPEKVTRAASSPCRHHKPPYTLSSHEPRLSTRNPDLAYPLSGMG